MSNETSDEKIEALNSEQDSDGVAATPVAEIDKGLSAGQTDEFKWYIAKTATGAGKQSFALFKRVYYKP